MSYINFGNVFPHVNNGRFHMFITVNYPGVSYWTFTYTYKDKTECGQAKNSHPYLKKYAKL